MIERQEKTCPWCGGHAPLGTPCSPECETAHTKFHARAPWRRRFVYITVVICVISMLRNSIPAIVRTALVIGWAVWLCLSNILMPYSLHVVGCEKRQSSEYGRLGSPHCSCSVHF